MKFSQEKPASAIHYGALWVVTALIFGLLLAPIPATISSLFLPSVWWPLCRRRGALSPTLISSAGGIGTGVLILRVITDQSLSPGLAIQYGICLAVLVWMLVRAFRREQQMKAVEAETNAEIEEIRSLPPEEALAKLAEKSDAAKNK